MDSMDTTEQFTITYGTVLVGKELRPAKRNDLSGIIGFTNAKGRWVSASDKTAATFVPEED